MKKLIFLFLGLVASASLLIPQPTLAVSVSGYYRANGTYVKGYERTSPDGNPYNNYSYPGNYNPNTGSITGGNASTYLNNYYKNSSSGYTSPSTYSSYTYPTTPTCPINSYYDGISSCKCNYGYEVSGSSCVSSDSVCWSQTGYSSSYDSVSGNCKCNYGYVIGSSGQCVSGNSYCIGKIGLMSQYNSISKTCECMSGYQYDGSSCVYKKTSYTPSSAYTAPSSCPDHSSTSLTDGTKCTCDTGYQNNSTNDGCVLSPVKLSPVVSTANNDSSCKASYGVGSELQGNLCYCSIGYKWNSSINSCVVGNPIFTQYLSSGSTGDEVVALKNLLAVKKLYKGYVNNAYDSDTALSVKVFQTINNITATGNVGPQTRTALNKLLNK